MSKKEKIIALLVAGVGVLLAAGIYLYNTNIPVLEPKGQVGAQELHLIVIGLLLSVIVVVPVFTMLFMFSWKYRESNKKAKYQPDFEHSRKLETVWWAIPSAIIVVLSVITWRSSHALDPYKPLSSKTKAMTIQVVALDWRWLFIYPEQGIATVNFVEFPVNTPVNFKITSDAPMNSFWIPQLGGQIYAMPGMSTQLYLMASKAGNYDGRSANISGSGFANMQFTAEATSQNSFNRWLEIAKRSPLKLTQSSYNQLAKPIQSSSVYFYASVSPNLYASIINKYMAPGGSIKGELSH